jgi:hypothetical protein
MARVALDQFEFSDSLLRMRDLVASPLLCDVSRLKDELLLRMDDFYVADAEKPLSAGD